jgi:hypothetical protein
VDARGHSRINARGLSTKNPSIDKEGLFGKSMEAEKNLPI